MTKYKCNSCGAMDSDRTSQPPQALHCWKCGVGRGISNWMQMVESREGMFPVDENGVFPWEK